MNLSTSQHITTIDKTKSTTRVLKGVGSNSFSWDLSQFSYSWPLKACNWDNSTEGSIILCLSYCATGCRLWHCVHISWIWNRASPWITYKSFYLFFYYYYFLYFYYYFWFFVLSLTSSNFKLFLLFKSLWFNGWY